MTYERNENVVIKMSIKETDLMEIGVLGTTEDLARADLYGLLAALFQAPPDMALLDKICNSVKSDASFPQNSDTPLEKAWLTVVDAAKDHSANSWRDEFETHFSGVGRPHIFLNGSFYIAGHLNEKPLVEIRRALHELGLESAATTSETEDHIASLCEVMRYLIVGEDVEISNLTNQRIFFNDHIRNWYDDLCDAIENNPQMFSYHSVANLTREFLSIEGQGFDML